MRVHDGPPGVNTPLTPFVLLVLVLAGIIWGILAIPDQTPEEEDHALMKKAAINLERCTAEIMEWRDMAREYKEVLDDKAHPTRLGEIEEKQQEDNSVSTRKERE